MGQKNSFADIRTSYPGKICFSSVIVEFLLLFSCCYYCCCSFSCCFCWVFSSSFLVVIVIVQAATKVGTFAAQLQVAVCYLFYFRDKSYWFRGIFRDKKCNLQTDSNSERNSILSIIHLLLVRFERNLLCILVTCVEKVLSLFSLVGQLWDKYLLN